MIEASLVYLVSVYAVYCVWFAMKKPTKHTYRVYTTWHPKVHTAKTWAEAREWADAYRKVECSVFIDGNQVQ